MSFPGTPSARGRILLAAAALGGLALLAYWPALRGGFILDDDVFLTQNALVKAGDGLRRIWFTGQAVDYWPVTSSSLWIEWRLWGAHPAGYHATNLLLHVIDCLLLWRILVRLEIPGAYLAALLFAVHPLNVESVAWITQRKNVLALLFFLLSILAFLGAEFPRGPSPPRQSAWRWSLSLGAFVLALLSKASVVPLPLVLLGLIVWRRRPTRRDLWRLAPFFAIAVLFAALNVQFQSRGNAEIIRLAGPAERLALAGTIPWFYLSKILLPVHLSFVYPLWLVDPRAITWWLGLAAVVGLTAFLAWPGHGRSRPAAFAWAYYGMMLLPVLGLVDIRFMRFSLVADHYAHPAMIGILALAAGAWVRLAARGPAWAVLTGVGAVAAVGGLTVLTWRQSGLYRDAQTLYAAALARNPSSWLLHNNLGFALQNQGRTEEAIAQYEEAARLRPSYAEAHNNLGALLSAAGRYDEALPHCEAAVRLEPSFADANDNLGVLLALRGKTAEAIALFRRALAEQPDFAQAHNNLAIALQAQGQTEEAREHLETAARLRAAAESP